MQKPGLQHSRLAEAGRAVETKGKRHESTNVEKESGMNNGEERNHWRAFNRSSPCNKVALCLDRRHRTIMSTEELKKNGDQGCQECSGNAREWAVLFQRPHGLILYDEWCAGTPLLNTVRKLLYSQGIAIFEKSTVKTSNSVWSVTA